MLLARGLAACSHSPRPCHLLCPRCPQVLGEVGALPDVFTELEINFFLLRRLLGVRTSGDEKQGKVGGWLASWAVGRASACLRGLSQVPSQLPPVPPSCCSRACRPSVALSCAP